ncbi:Cytochrome c heme lyase subunit CcmF [Salmonella enterica subsp. arizonae]|uniref:Cytochrome c heme lyase subunit CcmF n=1 Tax=Salmonella enterica subsp. arizonae TaxID=59203 RepID=A0A379RZM2_SALER|nr:Cytochrome c heme lyase subunit CcmF [Salmonella enterica subsp. arizonae]
MSGWTLAVAVFSRPVPVDIVARVLAVMGMVSAGFLVFILFTSNPFARTLPDFPVEGRDLNPLLQDPGADFPSAAAVHGLCRFLGGPSPLPSPRCCAGVWTARLPVFPVPWTLAAWVFLTLGIVLGSAWAYYELGLGRLVVLGPGGERLLYAVGWRAPPCCTRWRSPNSAPALRRGRCCCPSAPSRCACWGTFLVRSGVLVSVHAFASDPARGMFILAFMVLVTGGSLLLFAVARAQGALAGQQRAVVAGSRCCSAITSC